jgi:hypothetical protein
MSDNQLTLDAVSTHAVQNGNIEHTRPCTRCKGEKDESCSGCKGEGFFSAPDYDAILALMTTGKGDKYRMRSTMTSTKAFQSNDRNVRRATYVHRLACFHGRNKPGDQCLPIMADLALGTDPWRKELDTFADICAKRFFGTDMVGASRWARALGYIV